ncbi:MAG: ParB N-terminal domain-containing protein [Phycicoccus sp.]
MSVAPEAGTGGGNPGLQPRVSTSSAVDLPLDRLDVEDAEFAVRLAGLVEGQVAHLATLGDLDPVLVERTTMRVVDGRHRIAAARSRGSSSIPALFVEGSTDELYRLAVVLNAAHGVPMTLADRRAAATSLLQRSPERSDRSIAVDVGLAPATVARLRRSSAAQGEQLYVRRGRDGRWRAPSVEAGKAQARALIAEHPEITLREVARLSGVSLGTACKVRATVLREGQQRETGSVGPATHGAGKGHARQIDPTGQPPSPAPASAGSLTPSSPSSPSSTAPRGADLAGEGHVGLDAESMRLLARLVRDPALCRTERGREVLARLRGLMPRPEDSERFAHAVPPHQLLETIVILRASARSWIRLANSLQEQSELRLQQLANRGEGADRT